MLPNYCSIIAKLLLDYCQTIAKHLPSYFTMVYNTSSYFTMLKGDSLKVLRFFKPQLLHDALSYDQVWHHFWKALEMRISKLTKILMIGQ